MVLLYFLNHRDAVHHRHGYVGDDEVGLISACHQQARLSVFGKQHVIHALKNGVQEFAQVAVVLHHEHGGFLAVLFLRPYLLFGHVFFRFLFHLFNISQVFCCVVVIHLSWNLVFFHGLVHNVESAVVQQNAVVVESQHLVDCLQHLVRILQGYGYHLLALSGESVFFVEHFLQRSAYQGERCAQLVAGFAEEVVLHQAHFVVQLLVLVAVVDVEDESHDAQQQEQHEQLAPDALPEGRVHLDGQLCHVLAPYAVRIGGHHLEHVVAAGDAVEGDVVSLSQVYPLALRGMPVNAVAVYRSVFA